jgi:hypothetical protein
MPDDTFCVITECKSNVKTEIECTYLEKWPEELIWRLQLFTLYYCEWHSQLRQILTIFAWKTPRLASFDLTLNSTRQLSCSSLYTLGHQPPGSYIFIKYSTGAGTTIDHCVLRRIILAQQLTGNPKSDSSELRICFFMHEGLHSFQNKSQDHRKTSRQMNSKIRIR